MSAGQTPTTMQGNRAFASFAPRQGCKQASLISLQPDPSSPPMPGWAHKHGRPNSESAT